ncbi:MAG: uncharacterized protein KVP18_002859 [Porospora cf. gigantea A]|uniref:uncharacterized protein n=1 Tax=Porospora cf. gigantea A TaxID=2853593 RepID=UPI003559AECB|nr:MAG: hypothetical protein KVP18_002859 [Porospora cf. gigantea A]
MTDYSKFERLQRQICQQESQEIQELWEQHKDDEVLVNVQDLPPEETGGLDPLEVYNAFPRILQKAFDNEDQAAVVAAFAAMPKHDSLFHLQRAVRCGLWDLPSAQREVLMQAEQVLDSDESCRRR